MPDSSSEPFEEMTPSPNEEISQPPLEPTAASTEDIRQNLDRRERLISRKQELEDRKLVVQLNKIELLRRIGEIDDAEASLMREKELAAAADRITRRQSFIARLCDAYRAQRKIADSLEALAEAIVGVIELLYPQWKVDLFALTSVAGLSAFVISKKGLDLLCPST